MHVIGKYSSLLLQGKGPDFILQTMQAAYRLGMPKTLACCERHVAIDFAKSMRTQAFWECIPVCSCMRIAKGLDAAYEKLHAQAISKIDSMPDTCMSGYTMRSYKLDVQNGLRSIQLKLSVPLCKAFFEMAEPIPSQAKAVSSS